MCLTFYLNYIYLTGDHMEYFNEIPDVIENTSYTAKVCVCYSSQNEKWIEPVLKITNLKKWQAD